MATFPDSNKTTRTTRNIPNTQKLTATDYNSLLDSIKEFYSEFLTFISGDYDVTTKGYLYVDVDENTSTGIRNTLVPYPTLAEAKLDYQQGDIIAVEKCVINHSGGERIINTGENIHIRAIDDRKIIDLVSQNQITNIGSNTALKIDGNANLTCDSLFNYMIDSSENASNYFDLKLKLKTQFGAIRLKSAVADINVGEIDYRGLGNLFNILAVSNKDDGVPLDKQDYIRVRYGKVYWGGDSELESNVDTNVIYCSHEGKSIHLYDTEIIRTHSEADQNSNQVLFLLGHNVLENVTIRDQKNTGYLIYNSNIQKTFTIKGVVQGYGATGSTFFRNQSLVDFEGSGILIHNGEIIYNGRNPNKFIE